MLPDYIEPHRRPGRRTCLATDPMVVTAGPDRICRYEPNTRTAPTDGDDMADMTGPEFARSCPAGRCFDPPADLHRN